MILFWHDLEKQCECHDVRTKINPRRFTFHLHQAEVQLRINILQKLSVTDQTPRVDL